MGHLIGDNPTHLKQVITELGVELTSVPFAKWRTRRVLTEKAESVVEGAVQQGKKDGYIPLVAL